MSVSDICNTFTKKLSKLAIAEKKRAKGYLDASQAYTNMAKAELDLSHKCTLEAESANVAITNIQKLFGTK